MKPYHVIIIFLFATILTACGNKSSNNQVNPDSEEKWVEVTEKVEEECSNTSTTPHGFEWTDYSKGDTICVYIKYKQRVNGYKVSAICLIDTSFNGVFYSYYNPTAINGHGFIHFQNDRHEFVVENPLFSDNNLSQNKQPLKNGMQIETDYIPFMPTDDTLNMIFDGSQSPFFFFDIDFDGEDELIVTLFEGMYYHGHYAYKSYKIPDEYDEYTVLSPMQTKPFDNMNDYARIDTVGKTITMPYDFSM